MEGTISKLEPLLERQEDVKEDRVVGPIAKQGPLKRKSIEVIEVEESYESIGTTKGEPIR